MSLIIAYVGKKGCVMASDKRKIGYFGDKENLAVLEKELYEGKIDNDDDFLKRAAELGISIKITEKEHLKQEEDVSTELQTVTKSLSY